MKDREKPVIVFYYNSSYVPQEVLEISSQALPEGFQLYHIEKAAPGKEKTTLFEKADFFMEFGADPNADELNSMQKVRLIQLLSAGYNNFSMDAANQLRIPVANNHGNTIAVAEFAIMLMLASLRKVSLHNATTKAGKWLEHNLMTELGELSGRSVGIVGMGNIGSAVAMRLAGFECRLLYHDLIRRREDEEERLNIQYVTFPYLLENSDILTIHTPLTPHTRHMIGFKEFELMKSTALLVNTSRGGVVNSRALYLALVQGKIAAAAIDVYECEPPDPNDPLFLLGNLITTPHMAGATLDTWRRRIRIAYENFQRILNGDLPINIVNKGFGVN